MLLTACSSDCVYVNTSGAGQTPHIQTSEAGALANPCEVYWYSPGPSDVLYGLQCDQCGYKESARLHKEGDTIIFHCNCDAPFWVAFTRIAAAK